MDLRGHDGRTVLHAAVNPSRLEVLNLYLDAGARPWIKDNLGITSPRPCEEALRAEGDHQASGEDAPARGASKR